MTKEAPKRASIGSAILLMLTYQNKSRAKLKEDIGCPKIGHAIKRLKKLGLIERTLPGKMFRLVK